MQYREVIRKFGVVLTALIACSFNAFAEDFHVEFTAFYWWLHPSGTIQTSTGGIDLRSDLGIDEHKGTGVFRVVVKPGSKHRINFEVIPYRFKGENTITRTFELGGRTYPVQDHISSDLEINYIFGGYQYDFVNNSLGHVGAGGGIAYFNGTASATSQVLGITGTEKRQAPIPLVGGDFRLFPIPATHFLNINGEAKGIALGSWGSYFQTGIHAGLAVAPFVRLQAGFNYVDADVHESVSTRGFKVRFAGPIFSLQLHD